MTNKEFFKEGFGIEVDINMCPYGIPCKDCDLKDKKPNCTDEFWNAEAKIGLEGVLERQRARNNITKENKK